MTTAATDAPSEVQGRAPGPVRRAVTAVVQWLLGDVPVLEREPGSGLLVGVVCTAAVMGWWLSERHGLRGGPMVSASWRMLVHGGLALAVLGGWELRLAWRSGRFSGGPAVAAITGILLLLAPIAVRANDAGAHALAASPGQRIILPVFIGAVLLLFGLKALGARLADWGIGFGDWRWWLPHHGVLLLALLPVIAWVTYMVPALARYYPMYKPARTSFDALVTSHVALAVDLAGWEFLFRGFLLFGIARRGDAVLAMVLQALPFFLLHSPKPEIEMLSSFFGGVLAARFCLRAKSFLPLWVIHVAIITTVGFTAYWLRHR